MEGYIEKEGMFKKFKKLVIFSFCISLLQKYELSAGFKGIVMFHPSDLHGQSWGNKFQLKFSQTSLSTETATCQTLETGPNKPLFLKVPVGGLVMLV